MQKPKAKKKRSRLIRHRFFLEVNEESLIRLLFGKEL
jgi:hypothetical protein